MLLILFLLQMALAQFELSEISANTTALKELVTESERNLESLDSYRFTLSQDQSIETINLTDGNVTNPRLSTLGSGGFNSTSEAMKIVTASLYYPAGQEENANATAMEEYLLNDTLYRSVNGKWAATTLPLFASIWSMQNRLNQSAGVTNVSDVRLLGTVIIDGEGFYVVEVIPRSGAFASLINNLLGPGFSISSINLSAFFNNTQLRYVLWISTNRHIPVAEYAQTNTTFTPEMLGLSSGRNIEIHIDAATTLRYSGFNESVNIMLPEQAKRAQILPMNNTQISLSRDTISQRASSQDPPLYSNLSALPPDVQQQLWLAEAYAFLNGGYYSYGSPLYSSPNMPYFAGSYYPYYIPYYSPYTMNYVPYTSPTQGYITPAQGFTTPTQGYATAMQGYTIMTAGNSSLGTYLTDRRGMTLYHLVSDQGSYTSKCTDATCTSIWPPFYVGSINVPVNLNPADFSTITVNGYKQYQQTTYKGWPLYYFYRDMKPGDIYGQGISDSYGVWSVVNPEIPNTFPSSFQYPISGAAPAQYQYPTQQPSTITISPSPPAYTTPALYSPVPTPRPVTTPVSGDVPVTIRYPGQSTFDVYLDGNYVGTGANGTFSFTAPAGTHDVRVWDGTFDYEKPILLQSGMSQIINVEAV